MVRRLLSPGVEALRGVLALMPRGLEASSGRAATSSTSLEEERQGSAYESTLNLPTRYTYVTVLYSDSYTPHDDRMQLPHLPESLLDTDMTRSPPANTSSLSSSSISPATQPRRKPLSSPDPSPNQSIVRTYVPNVSIVVRMRNYPSVVMATEQSRYNFVRRAGARDGTPFSAGKLFRPER